MECSSIHLPTPKIPAGSSFMREFKKAALPAFPFNSIVLSILLLSLIALFEISEYISTDEKTVREGKKNKFSESEDEKTSSINPFFRGPISNKIMTAPYIASDNATYNLDSIMGLLKNQKRSPISGQIIASIRRNRIVETAKDAML